MIGPNKSWAVIIKLFHKTITDGNIWHISVVKIMFRVPYQHLKRISSVIRNKKVAGGWARLLTPYVNQFHFPGAGAAATARSQIDRVPVEIS